jgi:hypothetical protein
MLPVICDTFVFYCPVFTPDVLSGTINQILFQNPRGKERRPCEDKRK